MDSGSDLDPQQLDPPFFIPRPSARVTSSARPDFLCYITPSSRRPAIMGAPTRIVPNTVWCGSWPQQPERDHGP